MSKTSLFGSHFTNSPFHKTINSPRQARDTHMREKTLRKKGAFCVCVLLRQGICVRKLCKTYGQPAQCGQPDTLVNAVQGIDLDVPEKNIFALLGHNGAGKTTTIKMLIGSEEPTSGAKNAPLSCLVLSHFYRKNLTFIGKTPSFYQDKLGTNIGRKSALTRERDSLSYRRCLGGWPPCCARSRGEMKNGLFEPFILKMLILPRQARDKHRENTQKQTVVLGAFR